MNFEDFTKAIHHTKHLSQEDKEILYNRWRKEYLKKLKNKYSFLKNKKSKT